MKKFKNYLSSFLVVTMLISCLPNSVIAQTSQVQTNANKVADATTPIKKEPKILKEVVEKRESNIKHFLMDDMSYEAVEYAQPVHYLENGKWKDINNNLTPQKDGSNQDVLGNTANNFSVQFAKNLDNNKLVNISQGKYSISWGIQNTNPSKTQANTNSLKTDVKPAVAEVRAKSDDVKQKQIKAQADNIISKDKDFLKKTDQQKADDKSTIIQNEKTKTLDNVTSIVDFKNAFDNVDLSYNLNGDSLKENIVLNKATDNPKYSFNINVKNLTAKLQSDNTISFYDDKDSKTEVFNMKAPYMYDANQQESNKINIALDKTSGGYKLTMSPDNDWLQSKDRSYPVTIDPDVTTPTGAANINDTYVASTDAADKYLGIYLRVGNTPYSQGITRSFIKFDLPTLKSGDMITNASLGLVSVQSTDTFGNGGAQVNAYKVNSTWGGATASGLNWANQPAHDPIVQDYQVDNSPTSASYSWDITNIVKSWYTTGNTGLMLAANNEASGYVSFLSSDCSGVYSGSRPVVSMRYINNSGLESYWTYHSQSAGRAGTGYINDYNGNLVFEQNDLSMTGNKMPVSIDHVFNSNDKTVQMGFGLGWRLNYSQTFIYEAIGTNTYYTYTDDDGTKHYFKYMPNTSKYQDELNLGLTLTVETNNTYSILDKKGNIVNFWPDGVVRYMSDSNGNTMNFDYYTTSTNGVRNLKTLTDGAGRVTTLVYTPAGLLDSITDPSQRKTTYSYDVNNRLHTITYPDTKVTTYNYDANGNLQNAINYDGLEITYNYTTSQPSRVIKALESNTDGTQGEETNIIYGNNETSFTDSKGKTDIYQFNNSGTTVSVQDAAGEAKYYSYADGTNTKSETTESKLQKTVNNILPNPSGERDSNWALASDGGIGSGGYTSAYSHNGSRSLIISKTDNVQREYLQQVLYLEKGKTYTISGYVKTVGVSNTNGKGANLAVYYKTSSGAYEGKCSNYINLTNDWQRIQQTFTIPTDGSDTSAIIRPQLEGETGTVYFDDLQLEEGSAANRFNLIENGDFSNGTNGWIIEGGCDAQDTLVSQTDTGHPTNLNNSVFKINGAYNTQKRIGQSMNVSGKTGDSFVLSGWAKANSVPINAGRQFAVHAVFYGPNGRTQMAVIPFNDDCADWQYTSGAIVATADYTSVIVYAIYYDNANSAYFDGIQFYKEEFGSSYSYDSKGNMASNADIAKNNSTYSYDGNNNLMTATDPKGSSFNYTYDANHNVKTATSAENVVYSFDYDSSGNPKTSKVSSAADAATYMTSSSTYTATDGDATRNAARNGNYMDSMTNSSGNTVKYNYNSTKGTLDTVTDPKQTTTSYIYDPNTDVLNSVSKTVDGKVVTNSYSYQNDRIGTITQNGFNYNFGYDSLGNNTTVAVGTQNLITNNFEPRTGKFLDSTYGNGQKVSSTYDSQNRVIGKNFNGTPRYTYGYDASGNIASQNDLVNGVNYNYIFDLANRPVQTTDSKGNSLTYGFDKNSNVNAVTEKVNGNSYTTNYAFDKDNKASTTTYTRATGNTITPSYDSLARLTGKTVNTGVTSYGTTYGYLAGANGSTTTKVESITNNGNNISNQYDQNGNISNIAIGAYGQNLVKNSNFTLGTSAWSGIDAINPDAVYGNAAYKNVVNGQLYIAQSIKNIAQGTYNMSTILKSNNYTDLTGVGFVIYYTDGTYTDYTWTPNTVTDLGNGYKRYVKQGRSNTSKTISSVEIRVCSPPSKTLNVTVPEVKFVAQDNLLLNNNFISGATNWSGIDSINPDAIYGNTAYKNVVNGQLFIVQTINNVSQGTYNMSTILKSNNYTDLTAVGFVIYYTDGTYSDYTWTPNTITDLGNGYKSYQKQGASNNLKIVSSVETRVCSATNKTLDVTVAQVTVALVKSTEAISNIKYGYNELNEVIREDNQVLNKTITYSYDVGGNITNKTEYPYSISTATPALTGATKATPYTYDTNWKDELASYDGKAIHYDSIGNPKDYNNNTYTWEEGRQLATLIGNGNTISYKYNDGGIRTSKTVNGVTTNYHLVGDKVTYETNGTDTIYYTYDSLGQLVSMDLNGVEYYYIRNAQGDVIGLFDKTGAQVAAYTYDTWGKLISTTGSLASTVGAKNPYRYRGYRYDTETGLYYLQSRYYSPDWGRFINADAIAGRTGELLGHNMFSYCKNNAVNGRDPSGFRPAFDSQEDEQEYYEFLHTQRLLSSLEAQADTTSRKKTISNLKSKSVTVLTVQTTHLSAKKAGTMSTIGRVDIAALETVGAETVGIPGLIKKGLSLFGKDVAIQIIDGGMAGVFAIPNSPTVIAGDYTTARLKYYDKNDNVVFTNITVGPHGSASNGIEEYHTGVGDITIGNFSAAHP